MSNRCKTCGNKARYRCMKCKQPVCGRCKTRWKVNRENLVQVLASNYLLPAGLCKECKDKEALEKTVQVAFKLFNVTNNFFQQGSPD